MTNGVPRRLLGSEHRKDLVAKLIANLPVYTNSEDGLDGPAADDGSPTGAVLTTVRLKATGNTTTYRTVGFAPAVRRASPVG